MVKNKNGWQKVKLGEVVTVYGGGTPSTQEPSYWDGDIPWLTPAELTNSNNRSTAGTARYITQAGLENSSARLMHENSILLTSRATIGNATINTVPMATNQGFINIEPKKVDRDFFFYWLKSKRKYLNQIAIGSTFPELSKSVFKEIETELPIDAEEQKQIASILSAFDDKIEVNNKIAKTLEEMAQAIFKEWIVKFRFPGHEKVKYFESELGKTPEGWLLKLGEKVEVTDYVANGSFASLKKNVKYYPEENYAVLVRTKDLQEKFSNELVYIDESAYEFLKKSKLFGGELILSNVGNVGAVFRCPKLNKPMSLGPNAVVVKDSNYSLYLFLHFKNKVGQSQLSGITGGSSQPKFNKTDLRGLKILFPTEKVMENFNSHVIPIYQLIDNFDSENQKLAEMRDLLLPKLMKGEIRV